MKYFFVVVTNSLPVLCAVALMLGVGALAERSPDQRQVEAHKIHQEIDRLNLCLLTLERPKR